MRAKRTLIISSAIMLLALVVTIVSVSAAWFGDIKHAETTLNINSARPAGRAEINVSSATIINGLIPNLVPAKTDHTSHVSWLLGDNTAPTGASLRDSSTAGVDEAAAVVPVYLPFSYTGSADASDGRKSLMIIIDHAYLSTDLDEDGDPIEGAIDYINEFFISYEVVADVERDGSTVTYTELYSVPATKSGGTVVYGDAETYMSPTNENIFFINDYAHKSVYVLIPPKVVNYYSIKVSLSYNFLDEELNPATINKNIVFKIRINAVDSRTLFNTSVYALDLTDIKVRPTT